MNLYLFFGYAVFWSLVIVYLLVLYRRQTKISEDLSEWVRRLQKD